MILPGFDTNEMIQKLRAKCGKIRLPRSKKTRHRCWYNSFEEVDGGDTLVGYELNISMLSIHEIFFIENNALPRWGEK